MDEVERIEAKERRSLQGKPSDKTDAPYLTDYVSSGMVRFTRSAGSTFIEEYYKHA
ncbi:MAG TPA: hypothetical protein VN642_15185 [Dongiaceae bacterium]|nr:hypothetical protein [Dongiaceae bacterium]